MIYILDASAIVALLRNEPGAARVAGMIADRTNSCYIHAINLCEVYYDAIRLVGITVANGVVKDLKKAKVRIYRTMDDALWQAAGQQKALGGVSLADCFAVALTSRLNGELVTSDHREFDPLASQGVCKMTFIR